MKKVNDLAKKYPKLNICYISCGDGWYWVLEKLFRYLNLFIEFKQGYANEEVKAINFRDIKEKFGGLRIYYTITGYAPKNRELIEGAIDFVEFLSYYVCELCGSVEEDVHQATSGWVRTICKKCEKKLNEKSK